jgi:hypothetical protein
VYWCVMTATTIAHDNDSSLFNDNGAAKHKFLNLSSALLYIIRLFSGKAISMDVILFMKMLAQFNTPRRMRIISK